MLRSEMQYRRIPTPATTIKPRSKVRFFRSSNQARPEGAHVPLEVFISCARTDTLHSSIWRRACLRFGNVGFDALIYSGRIEPPLWTILGVRSPRAPPIFANATESWQPRIHP